MILFIVWNLNILDSAASIYANFFAVTIRCMVLCLFTLWKQMHFFHLVNWHRQRVNSTLYSLFRKDIRFKNIHVFDNLSLRLLIEDIKGPYM